LILINLLAARPVALFVGRYVTGEELDAVDPAGAETNRVAGLGDAGMASAIALKMSSIFSLARLAPDGAARWRQRRG
jgi:hypothetical protein